MADDRYPIVDEEDGLTAQTQKVAFNTEGRRNFVFALDTDCDGSGAGTDTLDVTLYEGRSDTDESTWKTLSDTVTQVDATMTTGNAALKQKIELNDHNYETYIIAKVVTAGANSDKIKPLHLAFLYDNRI